MRREERFIVTTTDDIIVTNTLNRVGEKVEVTEFDFGCVSSIGLTKKVIPVADILRVTKELVELEDVTEHILS